MSGLSAVVGIDPSLTGTALAFGDDDVVRIKTGLTGVRRLVFIRDQVCNYVAGASLVVIEGYSYASRNSQAHSQGELGGVLRVALFELGIEWIEVAPQARAKWATGKGNAAKDAVVSAVSARLGRTFESNDHVDAWLLRDIGNAHLTGITALGEITKPRAEVLSKLKVAER